MLSRSGMYTIVYSVLRTNIDIHTLRIGRSYRAACRARYHGLRVNTHPYSGASTQQHVARRRDRRT